MRPTPTWSILRRPTRALLIAAAACATLLSGTATDARAQSDGGAPVRVKRPIRKPVIDLERSAQQTRPGQVVAGQPDGPAAHNPAPATDPVTDPATSAQPAPAASMSMMSTPPPSPLAAGAGAAPGEAVTASVRAVGGPPSQVQWRALSTSEESAWASVPADGTVTGLIEVRTGMGGSALLEIDGRTTLRIGRMSRVRLERVAAEGREELLVRLDRGQVEIEPRSVDALGLATVPVRVITPAAVLVRRVAVEVTHDAFNGTREIMLTRE